MTTHCLSAERLSPLDNDILVKAKQLNLSNHPTWRRLLHFRSDNTASDILSEEFFLSRGSNHTTSNELEATLIAFNQDSISTDPNEATHCVFPARFLWLSQFFQFPYSLADCAKLQSWAKFDQLKSVSLVLVSSYLSNPASSFGHSLMKINNQKYDSQLGLLDLGINYGALVPEQEPIALYILRGLFGGYDAGFSDKHYYTHDQAYSEVESRDAWEYELNLSSYQNRLLVFHLWEITGKKYQYFFLKENCAYRLAELLELALNEDLTSDATVWYAPIEIFHRLRDLETSQNKFILGNEKFIPSRERKLRHQISRLDKQQHKEFISFFENKPTTGPRRYDKLSSTDVIILDTLLGYYQFRLTSADEDQASELKSIKNRLLITRLQYPESPEYNWSSHLTDHPESPLNGERPGRIGTGIGHNLKLGNYAELHYSAYRHSRNGDNSLNGSSLNVLDINLGITPQNKLFINHLNLVEASKNNINTIHIPDESLWSWNMALGIQRQSLMCFDCNTAYGIFSLGRAKQIYSNGSGQLRLDLDYNEISNSIRLSPSANIILRGEKTWGLQLDIRYDRREYSLRQPDLSVKYRYSLGRQWQLNGIANTYLNNTTHTEMSIGIDKRF